MLRTALKGLKKKLASDYRNALLRIALKSKLAQRYINAMLRTPLNRKNRFDDVKYEARSSI